MHCKLRPPDVSPVFMGFKWAYIADNAPFYKINNSATSCGFSDSNILLGIRYFGHCWALTNQHFWINFHCVYTETDLTNFSARFMERFCPGWYAELNGPNYPKYGKVIHVNTPKLF